MKTELQEKEYHPELLSRRGEVTAWGLTIVIIAALMIIAYLSNRLNPFLLGLAILLCLSGLGISLGNWMDRHTIIRVRPIGIEYQNGLRHAQFTWDQIHRVEVYAHQWGDKVRVLSDNSGFYFRKLGEVKVGGEAKGVMGFANGDQILDTILEKSKLTEKKNSERGVYYYIRS